ncbi:MAG TPA: amidase [Chloroflexia bacterium]|nr:amidase [Chloroflexia bacterium]
MQQNQPGLPPELLEKFRFNLRQAGIQAREEDIQGIIAKNYLRLLLSFEDMAQKNAVDLVPAYLEPWGTEDQVGAAHANQLEAELEPVEIVASPHRLRGPGGVRLTSIQEIAELIRKREVSPVELTTQALNRIAERDGELNSFQLVLREQALEAARRAEREIASGDYRGPLHGVPLAVKDLLAMEGTITTAGSKVLADNYTGYDASAVERLQAAGAIIAGKTRMSEFAYSPGSNNSHYGPTANPWNLAHDSGGSSSGSAAAVAAGLVFGALGTDTGGSIRIPASLCGIVGLKPTFGRTSLHGATTLAWSLDHLGPLTTTVNDAAILLEALAGSDKRDPRTRPVEVPAYSRYTEAGVKRLRVGVLREDGTGQPLATPEVLAAWKQALSTLESAGAELVELDLPEFNDLRTLNGVILAFEAMAFHHQTLTKRLGDYGEFMRRRILASYAYDARAFVCAQQIRHFIRQRMNAIFEQVDLLSTPTMPYGAPELGDPARNTYFTGPFNALGWPAISVPFGQTAEGLPVGVQLAGRPWDEVTILRAARVIEVAEP